ncbi:hypothetical protein H4R34_002293 [Dimargaris verticillata]|uniref:Ribosomal protein bL31m N-terminal domain-containing protein n=1 Tax=Dimargaris verticillata TaxID=2761393 RepID=A0A9W8B8D2_9FUNG|nr:hypothetical protein H4R34_002293 [Dimargaris verticillata]
MTSRLLLPTLWRPFPTVRSGQSVRHYAARKKYTGPTSNPEVFNQKVILTDGSSITIRTTSPRPQIKLNKDTRNNVLWNPELSNMVSDESGRIKQFSSKFSGIDSLDDLADFQSENAEAELESSRRFAASVEEKRLERKKAKK